MLQLSGAELRKALCKPFVATQSKSVCAGFCPARFQLRVAGCGLHRPRSSTLALFPASLCKALATRNPQPATRNPQTRSPRLRVADCGCTLRLIHTAPRHCLCAVRVAAAPCERLAQKIPGTLYGLHVAIARCASLAQRYWTSGAPCGVRLRLARDSPRAARLHVRVAGCGLRVAVVMPDLDQP